MERLEAAPIPIQNHGTSLTSPAVRIYKSPRTYKQKGARTTGWIQLCCGLVSISCGIGSLFLPDEMTGTVLQPITYWPISGGAIYLLSGICGLISRKETKPLIVLYMVMSIISPLFASMQAVTWFVAAVIFDCTSDYYWESFQQCEPYQLIKIRNIYVLSSLAAAIEFFAAICGSALCCHGICCNSDTPYTVLQAEGDNSMSDSPSVVPWPNPCADGMTYALIPRTDLNLIKQIGHGGYSEVYLAKWNEHDVAAKRLHEECRREAEVLSKLDHPNIVKLLGVVDEKFDFFLILELCEGGSLRSYLNDHKGQNLGLKFYDFAKQAARPIKYLKEKKIVHKDIKSPNYLLTNGNRLKLGDFGLAKNVDITITRATETASYPWMAPELLRDNILSPKYDVFAYGVVIWELWTTQMPFEDAVEPAHLVWRICNDDERLPIPEDCPKSVADLMRQCWETDWKMRPNMEQVLAELASAEEEAILSYAT
ncbi:uncharacterized protein [Amphiura filiformis]|uniref:uncharacterized protein n=1 Tax=Amphiura filiformis TaxID=82378 RepID=UPI003B216BB7